MLRYYIFYNVVYVCHVDICCRHCIPICSNYVRISPWFPR
jgi:hypothetical protein